MPKQVSAGSDVRRRAHDPGPRRRSHRLPPDARREPVRVERLADDRARHARPAARAARRGAASSSSSTRGARRPPRKPTSTCRSGPATDALFLFALVHVLFADDLVDLGAVAAHVNGLDDVRRARAATSRPRRSRRCAASTPRRSAASRTSSRPRRPPRCTARIGTCTQEFGTLASWLVDVLQRAAPATSTGPAARCSRPRPRARPTGGTPARGEACTFGRRTSRVRGLPEFFGELPVVCLAEEIETPGDGQIRALVTIAGNPARRRHRTASAARPRARRRSTSWSASTSIVNETTRHANVILPPEPELARGHYDLALYNLAIRNVANYSPPLVELRAGRGAGVADAAAARGRARRARARTPTSTRSTTSSSTGSCSKAVTRSGLERRRARRRRAAEGARDAPRTRARPRLHAAHRPVRRRVRRRSRRAVARRARGEPARRRLRSAATAHPRGAAHADGMIELAPEPLRRRRRALARRARPTAARDGGARARRPARPALEQLVDAQPAGAREGQGALHGARASRRRGPARRRRRRRRARALGRGRDRAPGRGDRRGHAAAS